ncbi:uncharacterized protein PV09_08351 [Verruconis gallopava]|uniref:Protein kinase domain-containing protein n=1 Tax=Verruconis gallopava TaxID=253628 RepID=A0A0D2A143_9PEZI|nr:uncharacterized protein PV09_08351 [Verruconis gallopava]KIV99994.1 hypothetical protein PV09_08351 [Verruconis gallopava]
MAFHAEILQADSQNPETHFLLYRFSSDERLTKTLPDQLQTDFLDVLATANSLEIPFLPIVWQMARTSIGLGGTSSIRRAPVDVQTELAFKLVKEDQKALQSQSNILGQIRNELELMSHPRLRSHPNIVDILGLCWDIPDRDHVWPVLVMEKSYFGDLNGFSKLPVWQDLDACDKLKICLGIGNALAEMHSCDITHGDIKPHNVLIFKDGDGFTPKLADFGYSHRYIDKTDSCCLPVSRPWQAPGVDGSDKTFTLSQAMAADIYSYALLCAWIFRNDQIFENSVDVNMSSQLVTLDPPESKSIAMLEVLKRNETLEQVILKCVENEPGLEDADKDALKELFRTALGKSRENCGDIWSCFKLLKRPESEVDKLTQAAAKPQFKINAAILDYYSADYRLRKYIAKCLESRVNQHAVKNAENDAVQLAVCYYIGFGVPKDDEKFLQLRDANERLRCLIETEIKSLNPKPRSYDHPLVARIFATGHLSHLHQNQQNRDFSLLKDTENSLKRELDDLSASINNASLRWILFDTLIDCLRMEGNFSLAEELESELLQMREKTLGHENFQSIAGMTNLAHVHWQLGKPHLALEVTQRALQTSRRTRGMDDILTMMIMGNMSSIYYSLGKYPEAEALEVYLEEKRSAMLGKDHPDTITSMANRAAILWRQGRLEEAESLALTAFRMREKIYGIEQADTLVSMSNLALIYQSQGEYNRAEGLQLKAAEVSKKIHGELSPATLMNMSNLALTYWYLEKLEAAEDLNLHVMERRRLVLGPDHPDTLTSMANLALVYESQKRFKEAIDLETEVLHKHRASSSLGDKHPDTVLSMDNLANTYRNVGRLEEAADLLSEALSIRKETLEDLHPETMENTHKLLLLYQELGREQDILEIINWLRSLES